MGAKSVNRYEKDGIKYKQCTNCGKYKEANSKMFSKKEKGFLGLRSICKDCEHKEYIMNKDKRLKQAKERYNREKGKILLQVKEYYANNKNKKLEYAKQYRKNNHELIKEKDKKKYRQNKHGLSSIDEIEQYKKDKLDKMMSNRPSENRTTFHWRTIKFIKKYKLRPKICCICGSDNNIIAHHPDYSKWYEVVFCCVKCHNNIHAENLECPDPVNLLKLIDK